MTWIIRQTLFNQNVEIKNSPYFNDIKVSDIQYVTLLHICYCAKSSDMEIKSTLGVKKCKANQKQQSK